MARNPVQFQKGLSLSAFYQRYGTEEPCHAALVVMRWPDGFICPHCGAREHSYYAARRLFQCSTCRTQTSVKAGTIFHKWHTPLAKRFLAIHRITRATVQPATSKPSRPRSRQTLRTPQTWNFSSNTLRISTHNSASRRTRAGAVTGSVRRATWACYVDGAIGSIGYRGAASA